MLLFEVVPGCQQVVGRLALARLAGGSGVSMSVFPLFQHADAML